MNKSDLIDILSEWGKKIGNLGSNELANLCVETHAKNGWFTEGNVELAIEGVCNYLDKSKLTNWLEEYDTDPPQPGDVGMVMAGNIPMVGFHDMLCILASGHYCQAKLSNQDDILIPFMLELLKTLSTDLENRVKIVQMLDKPRAVIATGSNNSSRYFEYYFKDIPHIIRKNRTSIAVLDGNETEQELGFLGLDILQYFGLGCRNISKLLVPQDYQFDTLFNALEPMRVVVDNHKYVNNYDYNKTILLMNQIPFEDNGFLLLYESQELVSPLSVVFVERYKSQNDISEYLDRKKGNLQCIISGKELGVGDTVFGMTQKPDLWDYSDRVDTMEFLARI